MTAPSRSGEWPVEVRRFLTAKLRDQMLQDHGGWHGLIQWMYAAKLRDGVRLPMRPSTEFLWPMVLEDAAAWEASRKEPTP